MKAISFTDVCFGSEDAIKLYGTRVSRRRERAMETLTSGVEDLPFNGNPHDRIMIFPYHPLVTSGFQNGRSQIDKQEP